MATAEETELQPPEREFETGLDEVMKAHAGKLVEFSLANMKRTYDQAQTLDALTVTQVHRAFENSANLVHQASQNAIENANMVSKRIIQTWDFWNDHMGNLEPSQGAAENVVLGGPTIEALRSAVAGAVAEALASMARETHSESK